MCSWEKKRVRKLGELRSVSVFWEERRILGGGVWGRGGVESLGDGVVSGGKGSRKNENLGRKEAETRQMGLMGLMLGMRQCIRKIAYWETVR